MSSIKVNKIKKEKSDLHFNYPTLCMNLSYVRDIDIARPYISSSIMLCKYIYYLLDVDIDYKNLETRIFAKNIDADGLLCNLCE